MTGFGVDIWCTDRLHTGRLVRGPTVVIQALHRRFITPRGTLRGIDDEDEDLNYGLDVAAYLGAVGAETAVAALPGLMRAEGLKDDRIAELAFTVTATTDEAGETTLEIEGSGVLAEDDQEFSLTLAVDNVTATLLGSSATP